LREQPRYSVAIRVRVISFAHLDRLDAARQWLKRLLKPGADNRVPVRPSAQALHGWISSTIAIRDWW
jgi:hypothetical protein